MDTKDHFKTGTSLKTPTTPLSSMGAHTAAPARAATPPSVGALGNRGGGARPVNG